LPFRERLLGGQSASFSLREEFAYRVQPLFSDVEVYPFGEWLIKFRMTYPVQSEGEAKGAIEAFKDAFCEANRKTPEDESESHVK
jgi:hypothetical protein